MRVHLERGRLALDLALNTEKRVATVGETEVVLGDANVLLVDRVDVPGELMVTGTRSVEPRIEPPPPGLFAVFRTAQDLIPFLQCDARLADSGRNGGGPPSPALAYMLDAGCARIMQK